MDIYLSEQLKKLRKEKGNTQEDLARHLNISVQAVSKWERDEGFPDIALLPAIAFYYDVSVDDLLGVGKAEQQKRIQEMRDKDMELFRAGKSAERVALTRKMHKEFPNDLEIIFDLMYALLAENQDKNADEIIECGKRILAESTDTSLRDGAIQCLCFTYYYSKKDSESAEKYAKMAGSIATAKEELMPRILEGEDAVRYCQRNIQTFVEMIGQHTRTMIHKGGYTPEQKIEAYNFVLSCYKLLYPDGNCGFYHTRFSEFYEYLAYNYMMLGLEQQALDCLEESAKHATKFDTIKDGMYTAFMVNKLEMSPLDAVKDHSENQSGLVIKALKSEAYAKLQNNAQYQKIIDMLTPVATF